MTVSLKTFDTRHYLRVYSPTTPGSPNVMAANSEGVGPDETFDVTTYSDGTLDLKTHHGLFVSMQPDGRIECNRPESGSWERYRAVLNQYGGVSVQSVPFAYFVRAEGAGGSFVDTRLYDEPGPWEAFFPSVPLVGGVTPIPGTHPDPLVGQLRWEANAFCDDTGPRNLCGKHMGDLIGQGLKFGVRHIEPALDLLASKGMHFLRSWFLLPTEPGGWWDQWPAARWNPLDNPILFREILAAGSKRGLKWVLSAGGVKGMSNAEENAAFEALRDAIGDVGPEHVVMVEACNEIHAGTGDDDDTAPAELERILAPVRAAFPQLLYSLSATGGTEDRSILRQYTPSWMKFYLIHGYRDGRFFDKLRHIFSMNNTGEGAVVRDNAWWNEPYGGGRLVSGVGNKHELNDHVMELSACMAALTGGAWTVMSGPGVILNTEPLASMPGLNSPSVLRKLPQDLGRFQQVGHGGSGHAGRRIYAAKDAWRAEYAIHDDGRHVSLLYGPPEQHSADDLHQERATKDDTVIIDGPEGRVITGRLR